MPERFSVPPPVDLPKKYEVEIVATTPKSFMELSKSFSKAPNRRLAAIAAELTPTLELGGRTDQEVIDAVKKRLEVEGITISKQEYHISKKLLLRVYQWLFAAEGEDKEKAYLNANTDEKKVIDGFKRDGIINWKQVADLTATALPAEEVTGVKTVKVDDGDEAADALEQANKNLWDKIGQLESQNVSLRERLQKLAEENRTLQDSIDELENENESLRDKLANSNDAVIVGEELGETKESNGSKQIKEKELRESLPAVFDWDREKGEMIYKDDFIKGLLSLELKDRRRIVGELVKFSTSAMGRYSSFKTRKLDFGILNSPPGCYSSRATHKLRFTWIKNKKGEVTLLEVYSKGDSKVRHTEA